MPGTRKKARTAAKKKAKKAPGKRKAAVKARAKSASTKTAKKSARKKGAASPPPRKRSTRTLTKKVPSVEPGPPTVSAPPVEEPSLHEEAVGVVTHYYSHLGVFVVQVNKGVLRTGDTIHVKGHTTDLTQVVGSMEYEHAHVDEAVAGQSVGIKAADHTREHDIVYVVR